MATAINSRARDIALQHPNILSLPAMFEVSCLFGQEHEPGRRRERIERGQRRLRDAEEPCLDVAAVPTTSVAAFRASKRASSWLSRR